MNLIAFFQDVLKEQLLFDSSKDDHIIKTQDVMLEDIIAVGGENAPGIEKMENNEFKISAVTSGMTAYAGGEGSGLHESGIGLDKSTLEVKFVRAYYVLTHPQLVAVTASKAAVLSASTQYSDSVREAMARAKSRHLRGDGTGISGVLDDVAGVQVGMSLSISGRAPGTIASQNFYGLGTIEFQENEPIVIGTKAMLDGNTGIDAIVEYPTDGTTLKLKASVTVGAAAGANNRGGTNVNTWYVVRGTQLNNEYGVSPMGIFGIIDDGTQVPTLQGKSRATTPWMKSVCLRRADMSNVVEDFQDLYNTYNMYGNAKYFKASSDVYKKYSAALVILAGSSATRTDYKSKLGAGHTGLEFTFGNSGVIPIINDNFFPGGQVLLIDPSLFFEGSLFADDFIPGYFMAPITGGKTTAYETIRGAYMNFGTRGSRKNGAKLSYDS